MSAPAFVGPEPGVAPSTNGRGGRPTPDHLLVPHWAWAEGKRPPGWREPREPSWGASAARARASVGPPPEHPQWAEFYEREEKLLRKDAAAFSAAAGEVWRAMVLAPSLEVCEALLRGEPVPLNRLDPKWVARLGFVK